MEVNAVMKCKNRVDIMSLALVMALLFACASKVDAKEITIPSQPASTTQTDTQSTSEEKSTQTTKESPSTTEAVVDSQAGTISDYQCAIAADDDFAEFTTDGISAFWNKKKTAYYDADERVTGWNVIDGKLYYFDKKGKLFTGTGMQKIGKKYYYFSEEHFALYGVYTSDDKAYYFVKKGGERCEKQGVIKLAGEYYCIQKDASLLSGWYRNDKGKRYYFNKETYQALKDWNYVGKFKFFFNSKGQLMQDVRKKLTKAQKKEYFIRVNRTASCVTVYAKDGDKGFTIPVVAFICSAGKETPKGSFTIKDKLRWHELMGPCWGQWCMHLTTDILFHSVYYDKERDKKSLNVGAYNKLGTMASHGCVRMRAGDCKWIYDNCDVGTKVEIYNNKKNPGPFDKPSIKKLSAGHTWDPTDPTIK